MNKLAADDRPSQRTTVSIERGIVKARIHILCNWVDICHACSYLSGASGSRTKVSRPCGCPTPYARGEATEGVGQCGSDTV